MKRLSTGNQRTSISLSVVRAGNVPRALKRTAAGAQTQGNASAKDSGIEFCFNINVLLCTKKSIAIGKAYVECSILVLSPF